MIRTSVTLLFAAVAYAQGASLPERETTIMSGTATLESGVWIRYKAVVSRFANPTDDIARGLGEGGLAVSKNTIHRWMTHKVKGVYFGYDLVIGPGDAANSYEVRFGPFADEKGIWMSTTGAGDPLQSKRMPGPNGLLWTSLAKYPSPQIVHDGDVILLDLMVSPDGKQRLTDYIEFFAREPVPPAATTTAEPRDFTVDDGPVTFDFMSCTIRRDGQELQGRRISTTRPGVTLWVAMPDQGRYILSLVPHDGFKKAGAIRDNVVLFQDGGKEYEIRFMTPIAGAGKAWNLYLMHDPTYVPKESVRQSISMGTDRLDQLIPKP